MTAMSEKLNRYGFVVAKNANKLQIRKAVEVMYGVNVKEINTLIVGGKDKTRYTKAGMVHGRSSAYKKAIVTLAEGEKIDFYSNI